MKVVYIVRWKVYTVSLITYLYLVVYLYSDTVFFFAVRYVSSA